jgi:hypothetical protein
LTALIYKTLKVYTTIIRSHSKGKRTMPKQRRQFNHDYFLSSHDRTSGLDNIDDAIQTVGRKYCCTPGHGGEGVLIYGTHCPISSEDYCTVLDGRIEDWKRHYIIIDSLHFHLCFCILHIKATKWIKVLFEDFLDLGKETNFTYKKIVQISERKRSPPLLDFIEHCVTRLTKEDQATLFLLHDTLEDADKIRVVYLVLGYGWDFVLTEIRVGGPNCYKDLPLFKKHMKKEQFKTNYDVNVNAIIQRSTTLYGKYLDELKQDRKLFVRKAKGVGKMIRMKDDDDGNDGDLDGGGVGDVGEGGGGGDNDDADDDDDIK